MPSSRQTPVANSIWPILVGDIFCASMGKDDTMKNFKIAFVAIFLVVTTLWLMADSLLPHPFNYFSFRKPFVLYSGIIGFTALVYLASKLMKEPEKA